MLQQVRRRPISALGWRFGMVALATSAVALAGCSGEQPTGSPSDEQAVPRHSAHSGVLAPPATADWNLADAEYLTMMIPHHRQALDMAELAETRAEDPRVRAIARAIDRGQSREIIVMATWLVSHDLSEPSLDDVETMYAMAGSPGGMAGMLSPELMTELAAASGTDFDRRFLEGMIQHHRGAVGMADDLLASGKDQRVGEMATEVVAIQNGEIRRLEDLLSSLS